MQRFLFAILLTVHAGASATAAEDAATTWTQWEQALTSTRAYDNPFADIVVSVDLKGPSGDSFSSAGFWDGGTSFKVRAMFPTPGRWTWRTTCSDPTNAGLHHRSGVVEVSAYRGDNPLRRRGYLKVGPGRRHLSHGDGTPFLWVGDTAWSAPMQATYDQWKSYVSDRRRKRFTVVQVFCASDWSGKKDVLGNPPFVGEGLTKWGPAYWREYERKVQLANDEGLVVVVMGLMEPVKRYPDAESARRFARQLAGRLAGSFVVFSPSFDSKAMDLADKVAEAVRQAAPRHLITQHPGTDLGAAKHYHDSPMLDFAGLQTGAGWGSKPLSPVTASRTAVEWSETLYRMQPPKAFVNLEARYDSEFNQKQLARLPRSCGYWTILSGAAGYTYGCAGIWNWGQAFVSKDPQASPWDWETGLDRPSSTWMRHLAEFFGEIEWWRLQPCRELVGDQPKDATRRIVMARTARGDLAVAYLPDNPSINIDMKSFPTPMKARWHDPRTGARRAVESLLGPGEHELTRPEGWEDALLVLMASGASTNGK